MKLQKHFFNHFFLRIKWCVHLSYYYKCHEINFERDETYIDYTNWIKNKRATINLINEKDNKCFQYAIAAAVNHEEINVTRKE